jgi:hypothetical protein
MRFERCQLALKSWPRRPAQRPRIHVDSPESAAYPAPTLGA